MRRKLHGLTPPGIFRRFASTQNATQHNAVELRHTSHDSTPQQQHNKQQERNTYMKLEIDWLEMAKAVAKAVWPFIAGAFGGLFSGCTFGGIGPNFV